MTGPDPAAHDDGHPLSHLNALEMAAYGATTVLCRHCHAKGSLIPMSQTAWGIELFHEPGCPDHDDNLPTPKRPDESL